MARNSAFQVCLIAVLSVTLLVHSGWPARQPELCGDFGGGSPTRAVLTALPLSSSALLCRQPNRLRHSASRTRQDTKFLIGAWPPDRVIYVPQLVIAAANLAEGSSSAASNVPRAPPSLSN